MDKSSKEENGMQREDKTFRQETLKDPAGNDKNGEPAQIDDLIGTFGRYQLMIFIFKILIGATSAFNNLGIAFFAPRDFISYSCADTQQLDSPLIGINSYGNINGTSIGLMTQYAHGDPNLGVSHRQGANYSILGEFFAGTERTRMHNLNKDYDTPRSLRKECDYISQVDGQRHKCSSFQYDRGIWLSTIIDEWDLVCDRAWYISVTQSLYMSGFIISYLLFGYLSDRYGRWRSLLIGAIIEVSSGFGCAFASSITEFMFYRFLLGLGNAGRSSSSYLIMIEWTSPKWRMYISTLGSLGWVLGYSLMPWITLHFLHFRHMQLFVCFYEIIFIIWFLRLPESPRWLLTHKRWNEAYNVLLSAAKFNGLIKNETQSSINTNGNSNVISDKHSDINSSPYVTALSHVSNIVPVVDAKQIDISILDLKSQPNVVPEVECSEKDSMDSVQGKPLEPYTIEEYARKFQRLSKMIESKEFTKNEDKLSILDLFKWRNLRKYILILAIAWAFNSFIYYGLALKVGDTKGTNLFIAFTWSGLTEIPAIIFSIVFMKCLPRKTTNIYLFAIVGLLSGLQVPLKYYDYPWLSEATNILAKLFNSCSFTCILYQTIELFPTSIRQTAYSTVSLSGRIGSILAPFINELEEYTNEMVPGLIYMTLSIVEIVLIRELPETKGSDLPDTLIEAEKFKGTAKRCKKSPSSSTADITDNESNFKQRKPPVVVTM